MQRALFFLLLLAFPLLGLAGCGAPQDQPSHDHTMPQATGEVEELLPNDGRVIEIVAPLDGATFKSGDSIALEIRTENFDINAEGNHWHILLDGNEIGMIHGDNNQALRGLEAGTHEIRVTMANEAHQEYQDGDSIQITIEP